jgi:hypothetical protein
VSVSADDLTHLKALSPALRWVLLAGLYAGFEDVHVVADMLPERACDLGEAVIRELTWMVHGDDPRTDTHLDAGVGGSDGRFGE